MVRRHLADNVRDQGFARRGQLLDGHGGVGHAVEASREFRRNIQPCGFQDFGHRPVVTQQINNERLPQRVIDAFVGEKVANVKEVARVLAVERGDDLASV